MNEMKKEEIDSSKNDVVKDNKIILPRRRFLLNAGLGLGAFAGLGLPLSTRAAIEESFLNNSEPTVNSSKSSRYFRFAVIADTHIIDEFYKGPENNPLDSESIFQTTKRLESVRSFINNLDPPIEQVFVAGDYFHDYPSPDYDFYFKNTTRISNAKALTDGFKMPVHIGFGNHDYGVPQVSREMSHRLFKEILKTEPFYSIMHRGFKFIHLNNFLGETWDSSSKGYNKGTGSFGEAQLNWFEAELKEQKPSFVFLHYPLASVKATEFNDYGILPILKKYKDTIQMIISGHWHRWFDFARTFGAQHYSIASTRYDENAYMLVEVDTKKVTNRVLNLDLFNWATHYSLPYKENKLAK